MSHSKKCWGDNDSDPRISINFGNVDHIDFDYMDTELGYPRIAIYYKGREKPILVGKKYANSIMGKIE